MNLTELTSILQISIVPVALISGTGLLILSMTNRFGRITDRLRELAGKKGKKEQVDMLYRRAKVMQYAIIFSGLSVLFTAVLMIMNFMFFILGMNRTVMTIVIFTLGLSSLIISMGCFIYDLTLALKAIEMELCK
jgi:Cu/Ag efflux pump CusA